jgi:hypothetical protein
MTIRAVPVPRGAWNVPASEVNTGPPGPPGPQGPPGPSGPQGPPGTIADGDRGDITVSSSGTIFDINPGVVTPTELDRAYAPLASPVLTGDPQAPTPPATDADTSIATTAFVATMVRDIRNLGAVEGNSDANIAANNAAFAAAAASGQVYKVPSAGLFLVSQRITLTTGSGFESSGERPCEILMSSDAGHFDANTYTDYYAANRLLFKADTIDDVTLMDLMVRLRAPTGGYTSNPGVHGQTIARTARVLGMLDIGGRKNNIRLFMRDFREQKGGYVSINSCDRGHIEIEVSAWDCNPTSDNLSQGQATILDIDNDRKNAPWGGTPTGGMFNGFSSYDVRIRGARGWNIKAQEPWLTGSVGNGGGGTGTMQTDIFNCAHAGVTATAGFPGGAQVWKSMITVDEVVGDGVGEVADIQKAGVWVKRIWGREVYDTGTCKLVYGNEDIRIDEIISDLTKRKVVLIQPANDTVGGTAGRNIKDIVIRKVVARRVGGLWPQASLPANAQAAISIENSPDASNKPQDIYIDDFDVEGGFALDNPAVQAGSAGIYSQPLATIGPRIYARGQARNMINGALYPASALNFVDTSVAAKQWDAIDPTKKLKHDVSAVATATERTVTWPNADVNIGTMLSDITARAPLASANSWTARQTITVTSAGVETTPLALVNSNDTAGSNVVIDMAPNTAGPGVRSVQLVAVGEGTNIGRFEIRTTQTGAVPAVRGYVRGGLVMGAPTGGDKGIGTVNAVALWQNGVAFGTAAFQNTGASGANVPLLNGANTWSAQNLLAIDAGGAVVPLALRNSNATAGTEVAIDLSPQTSGVGVRSAQIAAVNTAGGSTRLAFRTANGAAPVEALAIGVSGGIYTPGATGTDKGLNTINATTLYEAGTSLAAKYAGLSGAVFAGSVQVTLRFARARSTITLANGLNSNTAITSSYIRITGPTAAFSIGGFIPGFDGEEIWLYNMTAFAMTIVNEDASSTAAYRIATKSGANVVLAAAQSYAHLIWDGGASRWILLGSGVA